jgi:L-alanine-DL-glutamate epimerase-like enolase superfamily enzyme
MVEEPVWPPENHDGLQRTGGIPISAGDNGSTPMDFERLMAAGAVDSMQPRVVKMGGITELRKIFRLRQLVT